MIQDIFIFTQYNLTMLQLYLEDPGVYPAAADVQAGAGVLGPGPGDHQHSQASAGQ